MHAVVQSYFEAKAKVGEGRRRCFLRERVGAVLAARVPKVENEGAAGGERAQRRPLSRLPLCPTLFVSSSRPVSLVTF